MNGSEALSLEQIRAFLAGSEEVEFRGKNRAEVYEWVGRTLDAQGYRELGRTGRGLVKRYMEKMTGLSRSQVTRLVSMHGRLGAVKAKAYRRRRFTAVYTRGDMELLAEVDEAHETLSGPATQKLLQRARHDYEDERYERLSRLSVAHLYRLRRSGSYRKKRTVYEKTHPRKVAIGERRAPVPDGRPGYLRVDTVHQGDLDGVKGIYHINAVDEVTQWEIVGATGVISEAGLIPVLEAMLEQFPFRIQGFHSDNGSEFINHTVSKLLNKLLIEQTKSRPRRSNDNGLVESKNGAVIRKHIGYGHITSAHAKEMGAFYREHFNPYLNFHRPCAVGEPVVFDNGKVKKIYPWYATPWEILRRIPDLAPALKTGVTVERLQRQADSISDLESAQRMQEAKRKLFDKIMTRKSA